jgi:hypothetical protein
MFMPKCFYNPLESPPEDISFFTSVNTDLVKYYENSSFFWTLSGVVKPSPSMGFRFRVSGFRLAFAFSLLTPDT